MRTISASQLQYRTVLRKQRHRRRGLTFEHTFKVFGQGKTCALNAVRSFFTAQLRPLHKFLSQAFHGTQHLGGRAQSNHLQCTDRLMQLLPGNAQMAGIKLGQIGTASQLCITHKTAKCLGSTVQRLAKFIQHPCQWAQITDRQFMDAGSGRIR